MVLVISRIEGQLQMLPIRRLRRDCINTEGHSIFDRARGKENSQNRQHTVQRQVRQKNSPFA